MFICTLAFINLNIMKIKHLIITLVVLSVLGCSQTKSKNEETDTNTEWKLVYRNDKNGKPVFGNKDKLISIVRKGYPIKIGWASRRRSDSTKSVEHVIDAQFLTIANGSEIFAQAKPFLAQRPDLTSDTLSMNLLPIQSNWILGTNGTISSVNINYSEDTIKTDYSKSFGYGLSWFAKTPRTISKEPPLWD